VARRSPIPETAVTRTASLLAGGVPEARVRDACREAMGLDEKQVDAAIREARKFLERRTQTLREAPVQEALTRASEIFERALQAGDYSGATAALREVNRILGVGEPETLPGEPPTKGVKFDTERWATKDLPRWTRMFLAALSQDPNVTAAAKAAGKSRAMAYRLQGDHAEFNELWKMAIEEAVDALEAEARRRALAGTTQAVYHHGRVVGHLREYSDVLLIFLLKSHRPQKFRERLDVNHSGDIGLGHYLSDRSDAELERLAHATGVEDGGAT